MQVVITAFSDTGCTPDDYVALTSAEAARVLGNPFYVDQATAVVIAQVVLLVWATAWAFRQVTKFLASREPAHDSE